MSIVNAVLGLVTSSFLFLAGSCSDEIKSEFKSTTITLGTFNIAWLGDGINDRIQRQENDYKNIAEVIKFTNADIMALEEIENDKALDRIIKYLPDFSYFVGESGGNQKLAILYRSGLQMEVIGEYLPVAVGSSHLRPGYLLYCKAGNFDWMMMVVHFKSTSRYDSTPELKARSRLIRTAQSEIASNWADSILKFTKEKDVIILGDFNDYPGRKANPTLSDITENKDFIFLTEGLESCKYEYLKSIDHIVVSRQILPRVKKSSVLMYDIYSAYSDLEVKRISDHCPIVVQFDIE